MRKSFIGTGTRIIFLLLLIVFLVAFGLFWFDFLGLVEINDMLSPLFELVGIKQTSAFENPEDPLLLDKERLSKQLEAVQLRSEELDKRETEIQEKEDEIAQMIDELKERENSFEQQEKSFNERRNAFENRRVNLEQTAVYLAGMPPENATEIFNNMENDIDIIDIFRITEELAKAEGEQSLVAYWLSLLPPERSAELTRKMTKVTGE
jgi:flagellar protein FlbB